MRFGSHRIRMVVKFYTIRCSYGTDEFRYNIFLYRCFSNEYIHKKSIFNQQIVALYKQLSVRTDQTGTCESASTTGRRTMW